MDTNHSDTAPHGVIVEIKWEIHERLPDGKYAGHAKDTGRMVFDLKGGDRAIANEHLKSLLEIIKEKAINVSELKIETNRPREAYVSGTGEPREPRSNVFGMRGGLGRNHSS